MGCVFCSVSSTLNQLDTCAAATMWARLSLLCAAAVVPLASGQNAGVDSSVSEDACVLADGPDVRLLLLRSPRPLGPNQPRARAARGRGRGETGG